MKANAEQGLLGRKEFSEASSWGGHFCPEVQEDDRQDKAAGETEEETGGWDF